MKENRNHKKVRKNQDFLASEYLLFRFYQVFVADFLSLRKWTKWSDLHQAFLSSLTINLTIKCRQTIYVFTFDIHRGMHIAVECNLHI